MAIMASLMRNRLQLNRKVLAAISLVMLCVPSANAQTFKTLYAFTGGTDGGGPWGTPLNYGGKIYQTSYYGGGPAANDSGAIFEFFTNTMDGTPLYDFLGEPNDGAAPMSGLITDGYGDFFGTTTEGGYALRGTIYEVSEGYEFPLYNFTGPDGETPEANLLIDPYGDLFGTTTGGGANGSGTVFAFSAGGELITLHSFGDYQYDGVAPASNLVLHKGVLYGVTTEGGQYGWGTLFGINVQQRTETVLYNFRGLAKGGTPVGGLTLDGQGDLYGTTSAGGSANGNAGNGVVFMLNIASLRYTVLHTFSGLDGSQPLATLRYDGQGNFYGTTYAGGANGYGTVFELTAAGVFTTLHSFTNGTDGSYPYAGVALDPSGDVYGAATRGGQYNWGTLFEIAP